MNKRLRPQMIKLILTVILGSAVLTYWITHDRHMISRKITAAHARSTGPVLDKTTLVYCPICGESVPKKEEQ